MSNERFGLGELELEGFAQKLPDALFDFFGFRFGASECQNKVIGVPTVFESSEAGIAGVFGGKCLSLFPHVLSSLLLPLFEQAMSTMDELPVLFVLFSSLSLGMLWDEYGFDICVELIEQDIGENWAYNRPLWNSA